MALATTANPGFCLNCGESHDACEPDVEGYKCHKCKEPKVMSAEMCLMTKSYI